MPARRSAASSAAMAAWMRRRSAGPMSSYSVVANDRVGELVAPVAASGQQPRLDEAVERPGHRRRPTWPMSRSTSAEVAEREPTEDGHAPWPARRRRRCPTNSRRSSAVDGRRPTAGASATRRARPSVDDDGAAVDERLRRLAGEERVAAGWPRTPRRSARRRARADDGRRPSAWVSCRSSGSRSTTAPRPSNAICSTSRSRSVAPPPGSQRDDREHGHVGEPDEQAAERQGVAVGDVEVLEHQHRRSPVRQPPGRARRRRRTRQTDARHRRLRRRFGRSSARSASVRSATVPSGAAGRGGRGTRRRGCRGRGRRPGPTTTGYPSSRRPGWPARRRAATCRCRPRPGRAGPRSAAPRRRLSCSRATARSSSRPTSGGVSHCRRHAPAPECDGCVGGPPLRRPGASTMRADG